MKWFKVLIFVFMSIVIHAMAHAAEDKLFTNIPKNTSIAVMKSMVKRSAHLRNWNVEEIDAKTLKLSRLYGDYNAQLELRFAQDVVYYKDFTQILNSSASEAENEDIWEASVTPNLWVKKLAFETHGLLVARNIRIKGTERDANETIKYPINYDELINTEKGIKQLYQKRLISKHDYFQLKRELLFRYQ